MFRKDAGELTELEGTTLGVIGKKGECTPYAVRREFLESRSPHWSGSAGAIYPLITRLEDRGLIRVARRTADARVGKVYRLTSAGRQTLRSWLGTPVKEDLVGVPPDPLRNRVEFLLLLGKSEQRSFVHDAMTRCQEHLGRLREWEAEKERDGDLNVRLVLRGGVRMMEARLGWLGEVAQALGFAVRPASAANT